MSPTILERWQVTPQELTEIIDQNPSLRGILLGYVAEMKVREIWFSPPKVESTVKPDDHDRSEKADLIVVYKGRAFRVEVKSVQSNSIRKTESGATARFQCDASDRREILLPGGKKVNTTCLKTDEFDVVAVNLFPVVGRWEFAFARNRDLPRTTHKGYPATVRQHLLASLMPITWPLAPPYRPEPFGLFDQILQEQARAGRPATS
ncbi:MAG: restriction endonuclease [Planctomycetes bacterium]|nr:restriction endonuclease [Planctomycetota bacterium]